MTTFEVLDRGDNLADSRGGRVATTHVDTTRGTPTPSVTQAPPAFATPSATRTEVAITTELGTFVVELFEDTPVSTAKFIDNVVRDLYSGGGTAVQGDAFIHRLQTDFVIQGGGYYQNGSNTYTPILSNITGELGTHANVIYTLSWALTGTNPATAGGQWFINLRDNASTLTQYPVFGQLVGASAAFLAAAGLPTIDLGSPFNQLPVLHGATGQTFTINDLLRVTYDVLGVAGADSAATAENAVLNGASLLANDSDMDSTLAIALVNGVAAAFGSTITLPSGAKLTVNANGTYSYDPNHVYDALNTGQSASDSFTYTLAGGHLVTGTATVSIAINGVGAAPLNHAPSGADATIDVQHRPNHAVTLAEFGFSDSDGNAFLSVVFDTIPTAGRLLYQAIPGGSAVKVLPGQEISAADIAAGKLIYSPVPGLANHSVGTITFQVRDNGGTTGGGVDLDPTHHTLTWNPSLPPGNAAETNTLMIDEARVASDQDLGALVDAAIGTGIVGGAHDLGRLLDAIVADSPMLAALHTEAAPMIDIAFVDGGHHSSLGMFV